MCSTSLQKKYKIQVTISTCQNSRAIHTYTVKLYKNNQNGMMGLIGPFPYFALKKEKSITSTGIAQDDQKTNNSDIHVLRDRHGWQTKSYKLLIARSALLTPYLLKQSFTCYLINETGNATLQNGRWDRSTIYMNIERVNLKKCHNFLRSYHVGKHHLALDETKN